MKLGIFGDSYACGHKQSQHFHWYNLLAEKLEYEVQTHGLGATSTFYSYNEFLNYHEKYDHIIFLVTNYGRYTKPFYLESTDGNPEWYSSINRVEHDLERTDITISERQHLEYLKGWFLVSDDDFLQTSQDLIVGNILNIRPESLIIPSFHKDYSLVAQRRIELEIDESGNCYTFQQTATSALGITSNTNLLEKHDKIACHFTPEVSLAFTEAVYNKFKYNTPIVCPKQIKHDHTLDYYYEIKS